MRTLILLTFAANCANGADVLMGGYDLSRSNANTAETTITRANAPNLVNAGSYSVDGAVYAQPLYKSGIGGKNLLFVVTMHDSAYAFDADRPGSSPVWGPISLGTSLPVNPTDPNFHQFPNSEMGCLSTPVISTSLGVIYIVCGDTVGGSGSGLLGNLRWKLNALNLADGSQYHAPVVLSATASSVTFVNDQQTQRAGLLLSGGNVIIAFSSTGDDITPYWGWVIAYDATALTQSWVWCAACASSGSGAGIWMSSGGISADSSGNLYLVTGNGSWNGTSQYGESFVKLNSSGVLQDFFTPTNWATLNGSDADLGSSRALLINDNHVFGAGKDGNVWIISTSNMGHLQSGGVGPVQNFQLSPAIFDYYAFGNNTLFIGYANFSGACVPLQRFDWGGAAFTNPLVSSAVASCFGYGVAYSSNAATDGIVWMTTTASSAFSTLLPGTLRALNSTTLVEIWNSGSTLGNIAKFVPPTVVNGKVYMASFSNTIQVYGLQAGGSSYSGKITFGGPVTGY